jgi:hypothetical protein
VSGRVSKNAGFTAGVFASILGSYFRVEGTVHDVSIPLHLYPNPVTSGRGKGVGERNDAMIGMGRIEGGMLHA